MGYGKIYGRTWWGRAWVEALERIDFGLNRLPRGRTYANTGRVRSINIDPRGRIKASVQGSRRTPYSVEIEMRKFSASQISAIKKLIGSNPVISSELSLGMLPEALLGLLNNMKIRLLPDRWKEISADCSCPDWANPCKHLAAVYYIIANEIDKNPFILFSLRGIPQEAFATLQDSPAGSKLPYGEDGDFVNSYSYKPRGTSISSEDLDLNFPVLDINSIFTIVKSDPLFYSMGDFKAMLLEKYHYLASKVDSIEVLDEGSAVDLRNIFFHLAFRKTDGRTSKTSAQAKGIYDRTCIIAHGFSNDGGFKSADIFKKAQKRVSFDVPMISKEEFEIKKVPAVLINPSAAVAFFVSQPLSGKPEKLNPSALYFNLASSIALAIIKSHSFIPEVASFGKGSFGIHYIPLLHNEKIKGAIEYLRGLNPGNLIFREKDGALFNGDTELFILSFFITNIISGFIRLPDPHESVLPDKVFKAFFFGEIFVPQRFEENNTQKAVTDWLEVLSIRTKDISPVIKIDDIGNESFSVGLELENKRDPLAGTVPFYELFSPSGRLFNQDAGLIMNSILRQTKIAAMYLPVLDEVVSSRGQKEEIITLQGMYGVLTGSAGALRLLGIKIIIPRALRNILTPRAVLTASGKKTVKNVSYLSLDDLVSFKWQIAIGDKKISREEFLQLSKSAGRLLKFRDEYIMLDPEEVKSILGRIKSGSPRLSGTEILKTLLTGEYSGIRFDPDEAVRKIREDLIKSGQIPVPGDLAAALRAYQVNGFRWLYSNAAKGFGSCLADDMGLGKTVQVISLLLKLKAEKRLEKPALVVCPTTLLGNWYKECARFAPSLKTFIYHGQSRKLETKNIDLVMTTYGTLRSDRQKFSSLEWGSLIVDEAQNIKNYQTDQSRAVKDIKASSYIAMTGTPVENRLSELWSIFDFLNRGYLGSFEYFRKEFSNPIEKYRDKESIEKLKMLTAPFILRRLKTDRNIISDLPEKLVFDEYCYLSPGQAVLYEQTVRKMLDEIKGSEGISRKGLILKMITSLKQICNHPVQFTKSGSPEVNYSGKSEKLIELLLRIIDSKEKALIFTQYKEMGELLVKMLRSHLQVNTLFFHGSLPRIKRDKMVAEFQAGDKADVMIISLKAGGTGLNLTGASNVIHYDLWWNPAVENQATDRAYRIGQKKNVSVYRLISLGTFEEKIDEMIKKKQELADITVSAGESWITELTDKKLKELFSFRQ
ncbi:MAG: DEAD/DEAH box helicase [Ignavibacteria bacterium]|jgi:superfamily II DNA or RNA helicase|nr:DEAD/DEAH box helicase [Ignavibacteria bacterium]MCU7519109.1 DEAD/DEAH box helicase [Ignavibacteria bacterium]